MTSQRTGGMVLVYAEWSAGRRTMPDFGHGWGASVLVPWPEKIKRLQRLLIGEVGPAPLCIFEMHSGGVVPGAQGTFSLPANGGEGWAWIVRGQRRPRGHEGGSKAGISEDINVFAQGVRGVVEVGRDVLDVWLQVSVGPRDQGLVRTATRTIVAP